MQRFTISLISFSKSLTLEKTVFLILTLLVGGLPVRAEETRTIQQDLTAARSVLWNTNSIAVCWENPSGRDANSDLKFGDFDGDRKTDVFVRW